jgi:hypothetical protein
MNLRKGLMVTLFFLFAGSFGIAAQDNAPEPALTTIKIYEGNMYYIFRYKDVKPDDVPQEIYDGLWEIQKEVIDNFTYDYDVLYGRRRAPRMETLEDYYKHGRGVCENYSNFFILLAKEKGITENLYKISGNRRGGGHAWLEYRTENNVYIIDPTWSDDYALRGQSIKQKFRESRAYGREAFFITYAEDKIIFSRTKQSYNHSTYTNRTETPLWERSVSMVFAAVSEDTENTDDTEDPDT